MSGARARRARGPTPDVESSRERIHRVALGLFARYGFDGVSLQLIADEAGLHKSSLFHHYRGKVALAQEVFAESIARVANLLQPLEDDQPPKIDTLVDVAGALSDYFSEEPASARLIVTFMTAPDDSDLRVPNDSVERPHPVELFYLRFGGWLERAKKAGVIAPVNLRQTMVNLMGLVLFYPAVAQDLPEVVGNEPFSTKARGIRRRELDRAIRGMLAAP